MKIAVVTSNVGLDIKYPNNTIFKTADYFIFSTNVKNKIDNVNIFEINSLTDFERYTKRRTAKPYKIIPELFLNDYDYFIWHDITHELLIDPRILIENYTGLNDFSLFKHKFRDCLYDEAKFIKKIKFDDKKLINEQIKYYKYKKHPRNSGLFELSAFIKANNSKTRQFSFLWMEQIIKFSSRDQLSFAYLLNKLNLNYNLFPGYVNGYNENEIFKQVTFSNHSRKYDF